MRRPIRIQLLLPVLPVVLLAIVAASGTSADLDIQRANRRQQEHLARVVDTLTEPAFPLADNVLRKMSGLSGAEFVVLDADNRLEGSTLPLDREALQLASPAEGQSRRKFVGRRAGCGSRGADLSGHADARHAGTATFARPDWLVVLYPEDQWWARARQAAYPTLHHRCRGGLGCDAADDHAGAALRAADRRTRPADGRHRPGAVPAGRRVPARR